MLLTVIQTAGSMAVPLLWPQLSLWLVELGPVLELTQFQYAYNQLNTEQVLLWHKLPLRV